jgi:hypothetical protein
MIPGVKLVYLTMVADVEVAAEALRYAVRNHVVAA